MKRILTLSMLFIGINCFAQKHVLALNLKLDSTYYMTTSANLTITEEIPGQTQVITTVITGLVSHRVTGVRDSVYEMEIRYKSLGVHISLPGGKTVDFNTELAHDDIFSKVMRSILDRPFNITINKSAKILSVKNIDNLYSDMAKNFPEATEVQKTQFKAQMDQSFGEKSFKGSFQDSFAVFPGIPVGINDKWLANTSLESVITAQIKTTYTLQAIGDKTYQIHGDAVVTSPSNAEFKQLNGMPMRYVNFNGTTTADIKLDKSTGWINQVKVTKLIKGTVEIKDNPQVPGGVSFPMTIAADMTTTGK
ncbi:MAG TPA: DUF6263 family protein [Mucilaginibacter sp.]|jgi:hypothetical protein|nr:DUF6263 family protein [Mucilaginibacter sp.]